MAQTTKDQLGQRLSDLRDHLKMRGLDGLIVWRADMFGGEEVRACDERLAMISGFTGSAGYALILADQAFVFSDGRYHLAMEKQLDKAHWQWRDSAPDALVRLLAEVANRDLTLGFDAATTNLATSRLLPKQAGDYSLRWQGLSDHPIDAIWLDRPAPPAMPSWPLADDIAGKSSSEKIADLQQYLKVQNCDGVIISAPDSVNWLLNIRGGDLTNTPFHLAFAYVPATGTPMIIAAEISGYECASFDEVTDVIRTGINGAGTILIDPATLPYELYQACQTEALTFREAPCSVQAAKAVKNQVELQGFQKAHLDDALAFCAFWYWLEQQPDITSYRETDLVSELQKHRAGVPAYLCDSFDTIMGSGENGAIIHYRAQIGDDSLIQNNTLLLIDSGAHYQTGTTDITRTLLIGEGDDAMRDAYSAVLSAHAALAMACYPKGANGAQLDAICRAPMWEKGLDYAHGTGHGVGHMLSVHEGPCHISKRAGPALEAGMVLSNEPGYYLAGQWGIRLENLIMITQKDNGYLGSEPLTLVPFEARLIDQDALSDATLSWVNRYHDDVYRALSPHMETPQMREWLGQKCASLSKVKS